MSRYYGFGQENLPVPGSDIRQEPTASPLMSVDEMGALLGLKKTEQYWLVHKNVFDTRTFVGRIWIVRDSFERWYENQAKYHKVNGEPPGKELRKSSLSAEDIAGMLGITMSTAYEIIKRYELETVTVDHCLRVSGHYSVIYSYKDKDGKRKQKWETYKTKAEAVRRVREVEYKKQKGTFIVPSCKNVRELLKEYVDLYGKQKWALSTYDSNVALINNYINPLIGEKKLQDLSVHFLERFYQDLLKTPSVERNYTKKEGQEFVTPSTIRDIHKILRSSLTQAVKWELIEKNPAVHANVPKYKAQKRNIWTADVLMYAQEVCDNEQLKLAINLAFSATLRINEMLGLTWDCVDISEGALREKRAYIMINKEMQRVSKDAIKALDAKDIIMVFPEHSKLCTTVRVLKTPKTESSVRKVFIPNSVAEMLLQQKAAQKELKSILGKEYKDYNLVIATSFGLPVSDSDIRHRFNRLIEEHDLPKVVFHSLRHSSITYKLKLSHGDVKAVQGDSGHSQVSMVTGVYSHILDDDRRKNADLLEEAFYRKKNLNPIVNEEESDRQINVPEGVDPELLAKALMNPEMQALLVSFAKKMGNG